MAGCDEPFRTYAPPDWQGQQTTQLIHGDFCAAEVRNFSTSSHEIGVHVGCNNLREYFAKNDRAGRSERVYTFQRKMGCRAHRTEPEFRDLRGVGQLTEYAAGLEDPSTLHFRQLQRPDPATLTMSRGARQLFQNTIAAPKSSRSSVSVRSGQKMEPQTLVAPLTQLPKDGGSGRSAPRSERSHRPSEKLAARSARSAGSGLSHGAPEWNFGKLPGYTTHNTEYGIFPDVRPAPAGRSITGFPHRVFQDFY